MALPQRRPCHCGREIDVTAETSTQHMPDNHATLSCWGYFYDYMQKNVYVIYDDATYHTATSDTSPTPFIVILCLASSCKNPRQPCNKPLDDVIFALPIGADTFSSICSVELWNIVRDIRVVDLWGQIDFSYHDNNTKKENAGQMCRSTEGTLHPFKPNSARNA